MLAIAMFAINEPNILVFLLAFLTSRIFALATLRFISSTNVISNYQFMSHCLYNGILGASFRHALVSFNGWKY